MVPSTVPGTQDILTNVQGGIKICTKNLPCSFQTADGTLGNTGIVSLRLEVVDKCPQILHSEHHVNELSCSFTYKITCQLHLDDLSVIAM